MNKEVELKAWVDEPYTVKKNIEKLCSKGIAFIKKDEYYCYKNVFEKKQEQNIRLRIENNKYIVTIKKKTIDIDTEVNDEIEFTVSSAKDFRNFLYLSGAKKWIEKTKEGWKYNFEQDKKKALIELCEIKNLGWFIEIEVILNNPNKAEISSTKVFLKNILKLIHISESKIENKYYSELLKAKLHEFKI